MKIGYCRQSSREQALCTNALNQQIARVQQAGAQKIYSDIASGRKTDRKELLRLFTDIRQGLITEVIITRLDRLGRSVIGIQEAISLFLEFNVRLTVLDGSTDINSASGRGTVAIQAAVAQMESDLIGERIINGLNYNRQKGFAFHPPFGYIVENHKYKLNPEQVDIARESIELFLETKSLGKTAKTLANKYKATRKKGGSNKKSIPHSPSGFRDWLKHPVLRGHTRYNSPELIIVPNTHPNEVLFTDNSKEWELIQSILKHGKTFRKPLGQYPLSGLIYCECGACCYARQYGKYYQCYHSLCSNRKFIPTDYIELTLINALCDYSIQLLDAIERENKQLPKDSPQVKKLKKQLAQLELIDNPAIEQAKQDIKNQIARLEVKLIQPIELTDVNKKRLWSFSLPSFWESLTTQQKTTIYHEVVDKIVVWENEVKEIKFKF